MLVARKFKSTILSNGLVLFKNEDTGEEATLTHEGVLRSLSRTHYGRVDGTGKKIRKGARIHLDSPNLVVDSRNDRLMTYADVIGEVFYDRSGKYPKVDFGDLSHGDVIVKNSRFYIFLKEVEVRTLSVAAMSGKILERKQISIPFLFVEIPDSIVFGKRPYACGEVTTKKMGGRFFRNISEEDLANLFKNTAKAQGLRRVPGVRSFFLTEACNTGVVSVQVAWNGNGFKEVVELGSVAQEDEVVFRLPDGQQRILFSKEGELYVSVGDSSECLIRVFRKNTLLDVLNSDKDSTIGPEEVLVFNDSKKIYSWFSQEMSLLRSPLALVER